MTRVRPAADILAAAFQFTADDFEANRAGLISARQLGELEPLLARWLGAIVACAGALTAVVGLVIFEISSPRPSAGLTITGTVGSLVVAALFIPISIQLNKVWRDTREGSLDVVTGCHLEFEPLPMLRDPNGRRLQARLTPSSELGTLPRGDYDVYLARHTRRVMSVVLGEREGPV
jgi:hypothetical protein